MMTRRDRHHRLPSRECSHINSMRPLFQLRLDRQCPLSLRNWQDQRASMAKDLLSHQVSLHINRNLMRKVLPGLLDTIRHLLFPARGSRQPHLSQQPPRLHLRPQ